VERPEAIMRDIIENRLKLEWEPAVLDFHNNNRTVQTHSQSRKNSLCAVLCWLLWPWTSYMCGCSQPSWHNRLKQVVHPFQQSAGCC
jgi:hypothetical protein